jgi:hypothetical protein
VIAVSDEQERSAAGGGLFWSSGASEQAHQDAEVVAGDVDQVALVDVLPPLSQVRRMPPRSRLWANDRSAISARRRIAALPTAERRRLRLA